MQSFDSTFAALTDPTRRSILARLSLGEATVNELAQPFAMTQPAVSRHLKVLEQAGLIHRRIDGTRRPCGLAPEGFAPLDAWLRGLQDALEKNYSRLGAVLVALEADEGDNSR